MQFVRRADTRQLLELVEQLSRLSLTLAALREQQSRAAQAAAARRAAELLTAEQIRRSVAAHGSFRGRSATPVAAPTAATGPPQRFVPEPSISRHGSPTGPLPASRSGRAR
jgi:septal ring factor EnvC (AmiA/AmiB activator)